MKRSGGARPDPAARLAANLYAAWRIALPREDWRTLAPARTRAACRSLLEFARIRRPHHTLLRIVRAPAPARNGEPGARIELVTDDMPFLVDTLSMTLAQAGVAVRLIIHPILDVQRNARGRLHALAPEARARAGVRESWQCLYVDTPGDEAECRALQRRLTSALADVRTACTDWAAMRRAVLQLCTALERDAPPLPAEVVAESRALLQYAEADHFTFLGYRESVLRAGPGGPQLLAVAGSGLGLLRDGRARADPAVAGVGSADIRRALRAPGLLVITKANQRATVHRPGYLDYIGVKRFDARGRVCGEARLLGLWTWSAYAADPRQVPWLRHKLQAVAACFPFGPDSHDGRRLARILETLPRDELFQSGVPDLVRCARAVLVLQDRARIRVILRRDEFQRFWSCLVFLPRERCDAPARQRIEQLLRAALRGQQLDSSLVIGDAPLAQLHVVVRVAPGPGPRISAARLERQIDATLVSWRDRLRTALRERLGEQRARELERRYAPALPLSYTDSVGAASAVEDLLALEQVETAPEQMQLRLEVPPAGDAQRVHLRVLRRGEPLSIAEVLPTLEHFGLSLVAERPYRLMLADGVAVWVQDLELQAQARHRAVLQRMAPELIAAFLAVRAGEFDDDGFHRLLIAAELTARQAQVLRACCRYLLQTGIPFSQSTMERALSQHPRSARTLWLLFAERLDPGLRRGAGHRAALLERRILRAIEAISSPDEDRILRAFLATILATVRTNFFRMSAAGRPRPWLSLKLEPNRIPGLPLPLPKFEIFVHGPRLEGLHLRLGAIARGGIRWSERPEDFRTEILGLMKAQHVKNTMIVPVGAKGGFVARRLAPRLSPERRRAEIVACYDSFIRGLLDLTDNIVRGRVVAPPAVRRLDGDDPYLVVAADKGTASFSDLANAIAAEYGFWLGDAFASGGSAGYDHKKMGITARGAWECVQRHFRELQRDIRHERFTVAGIGDMSGDVFGNGMLLSRRMVLRAAFNHQHIFLDPDPDPARAYRERARLFRLPRSGWNDYDHRLISRGGGVYERSAKSIALAREAQALLDLPQARASPAEIVRAILAMRVDLLWNGGIGTYVKASSERHGEIGDRANDAVRVDGRQVRALVAAEGGNLGFSQRGRIEYAARGGRLNADFIDNSAGVNTSDLEVNLKILLDVHGRSPAITLARRDRLLRRASGEVAALALRNNYLQSEAISLLEVRAATSLDEHQRLLHWLERRGGLDRAVEYLPDDTEIEERRRQGRGLTRPELALLLAYGKIALNQALLDSDVADDSYLSLELTRYFPSGPRRAGGRRIARHRLRRQIIATSITNSIVNRLGPALPMQCEQEGFGEAAALARAYTLARDSASLRALWSGIEALDGRVAATAQYEALLASAVYLRELTRWALGQRGLLVDLGAAVAGLEPALRELSEIAPAVLEGLERTHYLERRAHYVAEGVPEQLSQRLACLGPMRVGPELVLLMQRSGARARAVARTHFGLSARLGIDWLHAALERLPASNAWEAEVRERLRAAALAAHLRLSAAALAPGRDGGDPPPVRWERLLRELRALRMPDLAALSVAVEALKSLSLKESA
jgi:glutamate dehydrogenase